MTLHYSYRYQRTSQPLPGPALGTRSRSFRSYALRSLSDPRDDWPRFLSSRTVPSLTFYIVIGIVTIIIMEDKVAKLQAATDEAYRHMMDCHEALELTQQQLEESKRLYKELPHDTQEQLPINDTNLPELIQAHILAKNLYETAAARYQTNQRYLDAWKAKMGA